MGGSLNLWGSIGPGTFLVLLGGMSTGCFPLPMKFVKNWKWENIWLLYSLVGLLALPWLVAFATVSDLLSVYRATSIYTLSLTMLFGLLWGVGNVLFGEAVAMVGVALTFAIVGGLAASIGSLIPLILLRPDRLMTPSGMIIILGVLMTVTGVAILGVAGRRREKRMSQKAASGSVLLGISLCVASGVFGAMLNFSFAFGASIADEAVRRGTAPSNGSYAGWAIALLGGLVSNGGYAILKLVRNRTWRQFWQPGTGRAYCLSASMGILFCSGFLLYGKGATMLGSLGSVVGWPVFQATTILISTATGAACGEWQGADRSFLYLNIAGIGILVAAIVVVSLGSQF